MYRTLGGILAITASLGLVWLGMVLGLIHKQGIQPPPGGVLVQTPVPRPRAVIEGFLTD